VEGFELQLRGGWELGCYGQLSDEAGQPNADTKALSGILATSRACFTLSYGQDMLGDFVFEF